MPCRKENYLLLEQSVTVDPKEVDALVTRIGEALQLHGAPGGHQKSVSVSVSCLAASSPAPPPKQSAHCCCMRLRSHRGARRSSPYQAPTSHGERDWDQIRPWNRKRVPEDEPHRLLQELLLSGNLIKEAVRRMQLSADRADFPRVADNVPCS